jgi:hypothetical protein
MTIMCLSRQLIYDKLTDLIRYGVKFINSGHPTDHFMSWGGSINGLGQVYAC